VPVYLVAHLLRSGLADEIWVAHPEGGEIRRGVAFAISKPQLRWHACLAHDSMRFRWIAHSSSAALRDPFETFRCPRLDDPGKLHAW